MNLCCLYNSMSKFEQGTSSSLTLVRYAQSCAVLACQTHLKKDETFYYTEELLRLKDDSNHNGT